MGIACLHVYFLQYAQYVEAAAPCGFIKGDGLLSQEAERLITTAFHPNALAESVIFRRCKCLQAAFRLYPVSAKLGSSM